MRIVIIGKENGVAKLRSQSAQDHQLVVNVLAEQSDRADSDAITPTPLCVLFLQQTRESPQIIRLVQAFGRFHGDCVGTEITFLGLLWRTSARGIARQLTVDPAQITVIVDAELVVSRFLRTARSAGPAGDHFVDWPMGILGRESDA